MSDNFKKPDKEPWEPEWGFWIMGAIFVVLIIYSLANGSDNSGPACDLVRGC